MKTFETICFNARQCRQELERFKSLLLSKNNLSEKKDLLPLFKGCKNLTALLGTFHPSITNMNVIANEYDLFGDFKCDFVVGDSERAAYCFIEFEDATKRSVFSQGQRPTSEWGRRFEGGFSQIVDWAYKLADMEKTDEFEARFGSRTIDPMSIIVIGRSRFITPSELKRLEWRRKFVTVHSQQVRCMTYDRLLEEMEYFMDVYPALAKAEADAEDNNLDSEFSTT